MIRCDAGFHEVRASRGIVRKAISDAEEFVPFMSGAWYPEDAKTLITGRDEMTGIKGTLILSVLAVAAAVGCDQSKAELDSTKTQLTAVTTERDGLKTQLATAQQR